MTSAHQHDHQHDHQHASAHGEDLTHMFTAAFWDERYAGSQRVWSGRPNAQLVEQTEQLAPGRALDLGCGEGADAIWLAERGWEVTGVDVSQVALDRAAAHAAEAGVDARTTWRQADAFTAEGRATLPTGFDLVSAAFVHVPPDTFEAVYAHLAGCVAVGGSLLVLAHHPDDRHTGLRNSDLSHLLFTPEQVVAVLDAQSDQEWDVVVTATPTRDHVHDGGATTVTDTVVRAVRTR